MRNLSSLPVWVNRELASTVFGGTLTILRHLSSERKRSVLQFLYEAQLINEAAKPGPDDHTLNARIVGLSGADLREANLRYITLEVEGAALNGVNLENADLRDAKLSGIDLGGADLSGVDLSGADLTDANVTEEQLATCKSLKGATMPDGSKHD
jgi:uncharacterized protein YjbI with pentapeptide repeats